MYHSGVFDLISRLKNTAKRALYASGYYDLLGRVKAPSEKKLLVVMYHELYDPRLSGLHNGSHDALPAVSHFESHLRAITNRYRVVSLAEAVGEMRAGGLREHSVALTFDDGCASIYDVAYPLLRKYGVPATVFLLTGWVGNDRPFWWHIVRDMLRRSDFRGVTPEKLREAADLSETPRMKIGKLDMQFRLQVTDSVEDRLRVMPDIERRARLERLRKLLFNGDLYEPRREPALTWDQVREMTAGGIEFGAHTHTHVNIRFEDTETVEREIILSKTEIEEKTGGRVSGFAFPYGKDVDVYASLEDTLRAKGFVYACHAYSGINSDRTNPYLLSRSSLPFTNSQAIINRDLSIRFLQPSMNGTQRLISKTRV
ncbi:MAG: polysaccharide deacetylase family protein [bacterium]